MAKVEKQRKSSKRKSIGKKERGEDSPDGFFSDSPWTPPGPEDLFGIMDRPFKFGNTRLEYADGMYKRWDGEAVQKEIFIPDGIIGVFPVSPLHTPSPLGKYIMAEFTNPVFVPPKGTVSTFSSFPVEIGIFVRSGSNYETVDVFSPTKQKYALYGSPNEGYICRWASVKPEAEPPKPAFPEEAVLEIFLKNYMNRWTRLEKAVFPGEMARIFYGNGIMSFPVVEIDMVNRGITKAKIHDRPFRGDMLSSPFSTLHSAPIRLKELSLFKPEGTILVGGY